MQSMIKKKFGVGIVGLQPGRSWAAVAHVPALRTLADEFEIVGVANASKASSQAAAEACGIPHAFADINEMVASPEIDIVAVRPDPNSRVTSRHLRWSEHRSRPNCSLQWEMGGDGGRLSPGFSSREGWETAQNGYFGQFCSCLR
jgi:predicted dehydrogenase